VVDNSGTITGTGDNAVSLFGGGTVNNLATGVLNATAPGGWGILGLGATTVTNAGIINADSGVVGTNGATTLTNTGTITGTLDGLLSYTNTSSGVFNVTNAFASGLWYLTGRAHGARTRP